MRAAGTGWVLRVLRHRVTPSRLFSGLGHGALTVLLSGVGWLGVGLDFALLPLVYLAAVTPRLCWIDIVEHRLPNRLVVPGYLAGMLGVLAAWAGADDSPLSPLAVAAAYLCFMLMLSVTGDLGMGDVKLAGVLGLTLGMVGLEAALLGPVLGFLSGGIASVLLLIAGKTGRRSRIPFGPFLLAGFWAAIAGELL